MIEYNIKQFAKNPEENIKIIYNNLKPIFGDFFGKDQEFDKTANERLHAFMKNAGTRTAMLVSMYPIIIGKPAPGSEMIPVIEFMMLLNRKRSMNIKQANSKLELPIDSQEYILECMLEKFGYLNASIHTTAEIDNLLRFYLDRYYEYADKATLWNESNFIGYFYINILAALNLKESISQQDKYILIYRIGEAYGMYEIDPHLEISNIRGYGADRKEVAQSVKNSIIQYSKFLESREVEDEEAEVINPSLYTKYAPTHEYAEDLQSLVNQWYNGKVPKNLWKNLQEFKK